MQIRLKNEVKVFVEVEVDASSFLNPEMHALRLTL